MKRSFVFGIVAMVGCTITSAPVTQPESSLVSTSVEPPGAHCPNGGVAIATGLDANGDGVLEPSEVSATTYACTAPNQLVRVVDEPPGPNCAAGGQAIESGADANGNGVLDDGEVTSTSYACAAAQPLIRLDIEPPGANCVHGGTAVRAGVDINNNGTLDTSEVTTTSFVCEPPSTLQQLVAIVAASSSACPGGGQTVKIGFDLNDNGVLDPGEISSVTNVCGGISTLVRVDAEPSGPNCAAGGSVIRTGRDLNNNGVLEGFEVESTQFVCNPSTTLIGNVVIHVQADIDALAGIQVITGSISFDSPWVTALRLPDLQSLGSLFCTGNCLVTDIELPLLEVVTGQIELAGSFTTIEISRLRSGFVHFQNPWTIAATSLSFPFLESGGVVIENIPGAIESVSVPRLRHGTFQCVCPGLTSLDLPVLESGYVGIYQDNVGSLTLPAWISGQIDLVGSGSTDLSLPRFESGTIRVTSSAFATLNLPSFATGSIEIRQLPNLVDLALPMYLSGGLSVYNSASFQQLDVPVLMHLNSLAIANNPRFPTCAALALWQALGFPPHYITGNDDAAICP
jgi:hypothetical protein